MRNLLFITTDQQRYDSLGFTGNDLVQTPNLDALASTSVSFTRAFTPCPLCCPARQTLLSGVMPSIHGGLWNYGIASPIAALEPEQFVTWPHAMHEAGWRNDYLGKWHVHPVHDATNYGYDSYATEREVPGESRRDYHSLNRNQLAGTPMENWPMGMIDVRSLDETPTHEMTGRAIERLRRYSRSDQPWHLRVDFSEPHLPCIPNERFASLYDPATIPPWPNFQDTLAGKPRIQRTQLDTWGIADWTWDEWAVYMAGYYAVISQYDDSIGRLLAELEKLGMADDTIVIYTTDHGDAAGSHRMMDKHYVMYEEEVHVPLLVRVPRKRSERGATGPCRGATCDAWVSHYLDMGPTVLELMGLEVPDAMQGVSLLPEIEAAMAGAGAVDDESVDCRNNAANGGKASVRTQIFSEYNGQQFGLYTQRMIRDERYKFVWNPTDVDELYDLESDPWELENLAVAQDYAPAVAEYRRRLHEQFDALDDPMVQGLWMRYSLTRGRSGS